MSMPESKRLAVARLAAAGAILAGLAIAAPLAVHAQGSDRTWDAPWRAGLDALSAGGDLSPSPEPPLIPGLEADESRAVAEEVALRRLHEIALATGRPAAAAARVREFLERPRSPLVEGQARHLLGILLHLSGDLEGARRQWDSLGFISDFQAIGPFANERGSGFSAGAPPEREFDLSAEYPGKRGPVSWRRFGEPGVAGQVELAEFFRPNEEALAYLVTWIDAPEPTDAVLRIGSSGAYRVWIDGVEVAALDVERPIRLDQDAVPVRLRAGAQRMMILSGQTKGRWAFRIRITDDAGSPLPALSISADSREVAAPPQGVDPRREATPARGAIGLLERAEPSVPALRLLGWLLGEIHPHDRNDHPDREAIRRSIELSPDDAHLHWLLAESYREEVGHEAEREENPRRVALERALELDPTFDRARFALVEYHLDRFGNTERAGELLAPALARGEPAPAALELARRVESTKFGLDAAARWDRELEKGLSRELRAPVRLRAASRARDSGDVAGAARLIDEGLAEAPLEEDLLAARIDLATDLGDLATARELLRRRVDARPLATGAWSLLAAFERSAGNLADALAAIDAALRIAPQEERLHAERGQLLHELDREAAAIAAWEQSLALEPNQPRLRALTEYLVASEPGIDDEFRIDIAERLREALASPPDGEHPLRVLLENQASVIEADGTATRFHQQLLRVQTDAGIRQLDVHVVPYAHGEQWVRVLTARVHRPDGTRADAKIRNREPEVREGEYPVWSRAFVDLPPLARGDVVELEYLVEDLRQSFFGDYFGEEFLFGGFLPQDETVYTVRFPSGRKLHQRGYGIEMEPPVERDGLTTWRWRAGETAALEPEPFGPPPEELVPRVEVSTFGTWDEFATWYHHLIRRQFEASPEIRAKVAELVAGAEDAEARVRAIYEFVANEVRYIAWEFGVHGFQPYNAATIYTRRFGDCKDKATLICTMLAEVGIEAWPVLIRGTMERPREDLSLPLISHFNHCIAYVPGIRGGLFLDGTAENHGVTELPSMDRGAEVVVIRGDGAERHTVPWNAPEELAIAEEQTVVIGADGAARIRQLDRLSGDYAVMVRDQFEVATKREEIVERILGPRYPGLVVEKITTSDLEDIGEPVTIELELLAPRYLDLATREVALPPIRDIFSSLEGIASRASRPERAQDLLLGNPREGSLRVEMELPKGYRVRSLPEPLQLADDAVRYDSAIRVEGGKIVIERSYRLASPRVSPADYRRFKEIVDRIERQLDEKIVLEPTAEVN